MTVELPRGEERFMTAVTNKQRKGKQVNENLQNSERVWKADVPCKRECICGKHGFFPLFVPHSHAHADMFHFTVYADKEVGYYNGGNAFASDTFSAADFTDTKHL